MQNLCIPWHNLKVEQKNTSTLLNHIIYFTAFFVNFLRPTKKTPLSGVQNSLPQGERVACRHVQHDVRRCIQYALYCVILREKPTARFLNRTGHVPFGKNICALAPSLHVTTRLLFLHWKHHIMQHVIACSLFSLLHGKAGAW